MKICFLLSTLAYDGIKRSVVHFANAMQEMGHEVWLGVLHEWTGKVSLRGELRLPPERVVCWDGLGQGKREWNIYRFFRRHAFDVVHANTVKMNHLGRWAALAARIPCVIASEDNLCLKRSWKTRLEDRALARLGDGVVMISDAVAESFLQVENLPPSKVHVIRYGLPLDGMERARRTETELAAKRAEMAVPDGPTVVCAARLHFSKSLDTLIRAAREVVDRLPSAQFILAGDGDERQKLEALRAELRLQDHFHFVGARTDIYDILQLADVVTLCSLWEGLGFSLMEAMAFGKALVGTNVTGINEIIEHNRNGRLVPPQNPAALAVALHSLLTDEPLRAEMARQGRVILEQRFDVVRNATQLLDLYQSVLQKKGRSPA